MDFIKAGFIIFSILTSIATASNSVYEKEQKFEEIIEESVEYEVAAEEEIIETEIIEEEVIKPIIEEVEIIEEPVAAEISEKTGVLSGLTIVIDAGHQGKGDYNHEPVSPGSQSTKPRVTSGTTGVATGTYEYVLNLQVALKLRDRLQNEGVNVVMVRETHDVNISNAERATMANEIGADLVIRLHGDGSENSNANGFSMHVPGTNSIPDAGVREISANVGQSVLSAMEQNIDMKSRGMFYRDDLSGFNWLKVPGILIEMGFMSNYSDDLKMATPEYQSALVESITEGLINYYSY